jgi:predicted MFS family arabinose efflux permease
MNAGEVLVPIAFFALIFGIFYLYLTTRHKQRLALIEKGADASIFGMANTNNGKSGKYWTIRTGLFFVGIGLGVLMGNVLANAGLVEPVAYISMIFIFGGLALLLFYIIFRKQN